MPEWRQVSLGDVCAFRGGAVFPPEAQGLATGAIPFVKVSDMNLAGNQVFIREANNWITQAKADELRVRPLPAGATIFAKIGEALKANRRRVLVMPTIVDNNMMGAVPDPTLIEERFLYFLLQTLDFNLVADGTALPYLTIGSLSNLKVALPPLDEQRAIVRILGSLDDKIELSRRMNETLEAMARAMFKSWFVDFDPVRSKMRGEQPAGMDAATAALFPAKLLQTEHGEVPEGWTMRPLDAVATFLNGLALQKFPAGDGPSLPVIKIAEMRAGVTVKSDRASATIPPQYIVDDGDLLFSWSGSLDIVVWTGGRGALNQHLFKVSSPAFPSWFLLGGVRQHLATFQAIAASKATTMGHIQRHHLTEALVAVPPVELITHLGRTLGPIHERIVANSREAKTLAAVRDSLLPRLLSGDLHVEAAL